MADYENIEFKDVYRPKKVRKKKHYLLKFVICLVVLVGVVLILNSSLFNVTDIDVDGNLYYSDDEVINMADAQEGVNIFWGIDASKIKQRLGKDSYFSDIRVVRKLPSRIIIKLEERRQIAAIRYGEQYLVIDDSGIILRKSNINPKLTLISGLTISKLKVGQAIEAEEGQTLRNTLDMLVAIEDGDIFFKKIDVSGVIINAYIYDTLMVKGTPTQMLKSIKDGDLQKVVNNLFKNNTTRGTISLGDHNYMSYSPDFSVKK